MYLIIYICFRLWQPHLHGIVLIIILYLFVKWYLWYSLLKNNLMEFIIKNNLMLYMCKMIFKDFKDYVNDSSYYNSFFLKRSSIDINNYSSYYYL